MKSLLIKLAIFLVGGGAGFFAGKKVYENYYANIAQEEIDSIKDLFERRRDQLEAMLENLKKEKANSGDDTDEDTAPTNTKRGTKMTNPMSHSSIENTLQGKPKKAYHLVKSSGKQGEEGEEGTDASNMTEAEAMDLTNIDRTHPYVIDDEEFTNNFDHHDKISLFYYRGDDILCDEEEKIIENAEEIVGDDALSDLTGSANVWVRNEPMATDFEIVALNGTYAQMVGAKNLPRQIVSPREEFLKRQQKTINQRGEES